MTREGPKPYVLARGEGASVWTLGGRFTTKLAGSDVEDRLALLAALVDRSAEPPLHIHHREDEAWYVLEGRLTFDVADEVRSAAAGSFVFAPGGVPHAFTVDEEPTRVLLLATPSGFEAFATELGVPAESDAPRAALSISPPGELAPVAERYGIEVVGPPVRMRG